MTRVIAFFRGVFISPELLVIVITIALYLWNPNHLATIEKFYLDLPDEARRYPTFITGGLLIWCFSKAKSILLPPEDKAGIMQGWAMYSLLKDRVRIGLMFQALFAATAISIGLFFSKYESFFVVWVGAIFGSILGAITFYFAMLRMHEIIRTKDH